MLCQKQLQDGTRERPRKTQFSILTGPRETVTGGMRRPQGRVRPGSGLCQVGGEEREKGRMDRRASAFPEVLREHRAKGEGGSQWQVWMPVVTVRGGQESNWWQGQPSRWGTWPSWWDVYTLWGCSDSRKVWSFKIYSRDSQVLGFFFKCFFLLLLHCAAYRIFPHQESSVS